MPDDNNGSMPPPIEDLASRLERLEESARALVSLLMTNAESFETAWEAANRVCDRYCLPRVNGGRGESKPSAA
jgi:hypothetical protein